MEAKIKHLEFIQLTITRMAANSFILKGWSITLISALAVLTQSGTNKKFWLIALLPIIGFWALDGYFLRQERLFRKLYDLVREKHDADINFSMDTISFQKQVGSWFSVAFSRTLTIFYLMLLLAFFVIGWFLNHWN